MASAKKTLLACITIATALVLCHGLDGDAKSSTSGDTYNGDNVVDASSPVVNDAQPADAYSQPRDPRGDETSSSAIDVNEPTPYDKANDDSDNAVVDDDVDVDANASDAAENDGDGASNIGVSTSKSFSSGSDGGTPVNNKKCSFSVVQKSKFDPRVDTINQTILDRMDAAFKNSPLAIEIFGKYLDPGSAGKSGSIASPASGIPPIGSNPGISAINPNPSLAPEAPLGIADSPRSQARSIKINPNQNAFNVNQMFNQISGDASGFSHPLGKFEGIGASPPRRFGGLKPSFIGSAGRSGGGINGDFFSGFGTFFRRRKRMAVPPSPEVFNGAEQPKPVCSPNRKLVTGFLKDGHVCFIYKADIQGIETDTCQQKECNVCSDSGPAQCMPDDLSSWVWAWCPQPASENVLSYEYIEYPAYCSCKAIIC